MRRIPRELLFAILVTCIGVAPAGAADPQAEAGRKLAEAQCAKCHAIGSAGASPHKDAPPLRDIARRYPVAGLAEAFAEGITVGHRDMPEFTLDPPEIDALLAFLESLGEAGKR